ncbi:lachesin-like [Oculina patagonica]
MRNGQIKSSGRKIAHLNFDRIKRTDDGLYTCRANNSAGTKTHKEILVARYPAKILNVTSSAASSWIGQAVTLKCVSDGVPTPTLTWCKPDGTELNTVTAKESTIKVTLDDKLDFGEYKCVAYNGLDPLNDASMLLRQISMCIKTLFIDERGDDLDKRDAFFFI